MQDTTHDPVSGVTYAFTPDGENLIVDGWFEAGAKLPEHYHPIQEEHWSVVEGRAKVQNGRSKRVVAPEDGPQVVKAGTKHSIEILDEPAHLRCRVYPALGLQSFLEESAAAGRDGLFMKGGIPRGLRGARWAGQVPQAPSRGDRDDVPTATGAGRHDRVAGALSRSDAPMHRPRPRARRSGCRGRGTGLPR